MSRLYNWSVKLPFNFDVHVACHNFENVCNCELYRFYNIVRNCCFRASAWCNWSVMRHPTNEILYLKSLSLSQTHTLPPSLPPSPNNIENWFCHDLEEHLGRDQDLICFVRLWLFVCLYVCANRWVRKGWSALSPSCTTYIYTHTRAFKTYFCVTCKIKTEKI